MVLVFVMIGPGGALAQGETSPDRVDTTPRTLRDEIDRRQATISKRESPTELFALHGGLLGTLQWLATPQTYGKSLFGAGSLDLNLLVRPTPSVRLFLDVEGLAGRGPDQTLDTRSRLHADADRTEGRKLRLIVRELFARISWRDESVRFSIGKLDPRHCYAARRSRPVPCP